MLEDAIACRSVAGNAELLACYDGTVAALDKAEAIKQVVVMDRAHVLKTRRSLFSLTLPKIKIFGDGDRIDTSVTLSSHDTDDRRVFGAAKGAICRQIDDRPTFFARRGMKVTIKRAMFGSFFTDFERGAGIRVRRDR